MSRASAPAIVPGAAGAVLLRDALDRAKFRDNRLEGPPVELFVAGLAVPREEAEAALGPLGPLEAAGFLEPEGDQVRSRCPASGPRIAGSTVYSTAPAANRESGSSVVTCTVTSPRRPCGRPIRPTTTSTGWLPRSAVRVDDVDPYTPAADRGHHGAQRGAVRPERPMTLPRSSGCTRTCRVRPLRDGGHGDLDVVGVIDDAPDQVLQRVLESAHD